MEVMTEFEPWEEETNKVIADWFKQDKPDDWRQRD